MVINNEKVIMKFLLRMCLCMCVCLCVFVCMGVNDKCHVQIVYNIKTKSIAFLPQPSIVCRFSSFLVQTQASSLHHFCFRPWGRGCYLLF